MLSIKNNLDQIVYERIVDEIIAGHYKMGEKILAGEIAEKFEISKTPVTQAIKLLCNDGVFEMLPNGRIVVPTLTYQDVQNVCRVRELLESYSCEQICDRPKEENEALIRELQDLAETSEEENALGNHIRFVRADMKFHQVLVEGTGNNYLMETFRKAHGRYMVACYLMLPLERRDFDHSIREHRQLIACIEACDTERAKEIIKNHIDYILTILKTD